MRTTARGTLLLAATILLAMASAACAPERVAIMHPPVSLTQCDDEPTPPSLPPVDWSSVETARPIQRERDDLMWDYILKFRSAFGSCKAVPAGVKEWSNALD